MIYWGREIYLARNLDSKECGDYGNMMNRWKSPRTNGEMQKQLLLEQTEVEASAGGAVTVKANGRRK